MRMVSRVLDVISGCYNEINKIDIIRRNWIFRNWTKLIMVFGCVCIEMPATITIWVRMKETLLRPFQFLLTEFHCENATWNHSRWTVYTKASNCGSFAMGQRNLFNCGYIHFWLNGKKHSRKAYVSCDCEDEEKIYEGEQQ